MLVGFVVGTLCLLPVLGPIMSASGYSGLVLLDARAGVMGALGLLVLAGLPALLLGLYVSASGNPLSGVFTVGASLLVLAGLGGSIRGLVWRQAERGSGEARGGSIFMQLEMEMVLWAGLWCGVMWLIRASRLSVRRHAVPRLLKTGFDQRLTEEDTPVFVLQVRPALAGLLCALLGWVMCLFLMRSDSAGQVIGSLLVAFTLAGLTARLALPTGNVVYVLMSPLLVGFVAYAQGAVAYGSVSAEELILRWQSGAIVGPMVALPVHYASAGLVGVCVGIGMAQAIDRVRVAESTMPTSRQAGPEASVSEASVSDASVQASGPGANI